MEEIIATPATLAAALREFAARYQTWAAAGGMVGVEPDPGRFIDLDTLNDAAVFEYADACNQFVFAVRATRQARAREWASLN